VDVSARWSNGRCRRPSGIPGRVRRPPVVHASENARNVRAVCTQCKRRAVLAVRHDCAKMAADPAKAANRWSASVSRSRRRWTLFSDGGQTFFEQVTTEPAVREPAGTANDGAGDREQSSVRQAVRPGSIRPQRWRPPIMEEQRVVRAGCGWLRRIAIVRGHDTHRGRSASLPGAHDAR
jgi:hypothetical protein